MHIMTWFIYRDKTFRVKSHYITNTLKDVLIKDLSDRYETQLWEEESVEEKEIFFEPGGYGMYHTNQPRVVLSVANKDLKVDVTKAEELLFDLTNAERKKFSCGTEYYKLYSRFNCLIVTVAEREELLFQLKGQMPALKAQSDAWLEEKENEWQRMTVEYEKESGQKFPIVRVKDIQQKGPPN